MVVYNLFLLLLYIDSLDVLCLTGTVRRMSLQGFGFPIRSLVCPFKLRDSYWCRYCLKYRLDLELI